MRQCMGVALLWLVEQTNNNFSCVVWRLFHGLFHGVVLVHLLTPVNTFRVGDLKVIGVVDVLVRTLTERDLHDVLDQTRTFFSAWEAELEPDFPSA